MTHEIVPVLCWLVQVPLAAGPETLVEYKAWQAEHMATEESNDAAPLQSELPVHVRKGYDKAQELVKMRRACEAAVAGDKAVDTELLAAFMAYIKLEEVRAHCYLYCCFPRCFVSALSRTDAPM